MEPNLSNYNSIFELFAGISSALVGIAEFRKFIFQSLMVVGKKQIESVKQACKYIGTIIALTQDMLQSNSPNFDAKDILRCKEIIIELNKDELEGKGLERNIRVFTSKERFYIDRIAIGSYLVSFAYCVTFLVISALSSDDFLHLNTAILFLANLNILVFISYFFVCFFILKKQTRPLTTAFLIFIVVLLFTLVNTLGLKIGFPINIPFVIISSLLMCLMPLCVLITRWIQGSIINPRRTRQEIYKIEKSKLHKEAVELFYNTIRPIQRP